MFQVACPRTQVGGGLWRMLTDVFNNIFLSVRYKSCCQWVRCWTTCWTTLRKCPLMSTCLCGHLRLHMAWVTSRPRHLFTATLPLATSYLPHWHRYFKLEVRWKLAVLSSPVEWNEWKCSDLKCIRKLRDWVQSYLYLHYESLFCKVTLGKKQVRSTK